MFIRSVISIFTSYYYFVHPYLYSSSTLIYKSSFKTITTIRSIRSHHLYLCILSCHVRYHPRYHQHIFVSSSFVLTHAIILRSHSRYHPSFSLTLSSFVLSSLTLVRPLNLILDSTILLVDSWMSYVGTNNT
jgi:hypothetical protein